MDFNQAEAKDRGDITEGHRRLLQAALLTTRRADFIGRAADISADSSHKSQAQLEQMVTDEMKKRLSKFGLQDNQIEAILDPKKAPKLPPTRARPIYPKIHKQHLDIQTLNYYNIRWEYDVDDPNFYVILQEMTPEETDVLFEHTRQLRRDIRHAQNNSRRRGDQIEGSADVVEVVSDETSDLDNDKWIAEGLELDKPDKNKPVKARSRKSKTHSRAKKSQRTNKAVKLEPLLNNMSKESQKQSSRPHAMPPSRNELSDSPTDADEHTNKQKQNKHSVSTSKTAEKRRNIDADGCDHDSARELDKSQSLRGASRISKRSSESIPNSLFQSHRDGMSLAEGTKTGYRNNGSSSKASNSLGQVRTPLSARPETRMAQEAIGPGIVYSQSYKKGPVSEGTTSSIDLLQSLSTETWGVVEDGKSSAWKQVNDDVLSEGTFSSFIGPHNADPIPSSITENPKGLECRGAATPLETGSLIDLDSSPESEQSEEALTEQEAPTPVKGSTQVEEVNSKTYGNKDEAPVPFVIRRPTNMSESSSQCASHSSTEDDENFDSEETDSDENHSDREGKLLKKVTKLKSANRELRNKLSQKKSSLPSKWKVLYLVKCEDDNNDRVYLDRPFKSQLTGNEWHLRGRTQVNDTNIFIERNRDLAFIVYWEYLCDGHSWSTPASKRKAARKRGSEGEGDEIKPENQKIHLLCSVLRDGILDLIESEAEYASYLKFNENDETMPVPNTFWYHFKGQIGEFLSKIEPKQGKQLRLLSTYMENTFARKYEQADDLFERGLVTKQTLKYLFAPGEVILVVKGGQTTGYFFKSIQEKPRGRWNMFLDKDTQTTYLVDADTWIFDGDFSKKRDTLELIWNDSTLREKQKITELNIYPLRCASEDTRSSLAERGRKFWECRHHNYIEYKNPTNRGFGRTINARYMVDVRTYWAIHNESKPTSSADPTGKVEKLSHSDMMQDEPPADDFIYCLPLTVDGFDMMEKKWTKLLVEHIRPLKWKKDAFETLAVDEDTKELITALVSNKIAADRGTDLMAGKGTGLIVLLHGGPGTGKTLTAESVAEIAEKPLYRVTCGDIGTDPIQIEKYLESVFYLGKIWDCVVLLDEADVFLEQRSLADLSRNALVSVFLRVLEYYDGILVLTSNRVGTFDEAFKSRIQLALHYENLNERQRRQIWTNFAHHLRGMDDNIDFDNIMANIGSLSKYEMNGRQIRNVITTGRQLALYKTTKLDFERLKHVIDVSGKFDKYLLEVNRDITDDDFAREEGRR